MSRVTGRRGADHRCFRMGSFAGMAKKRGEAKWSLVGEHNMHIGLMAIAAARHAGVVLADACNALLRFLLISAAVWLCVVKRMV